MKDHPEIDSYKNLQKVFFRRIQEYIAGKNLNVGGWEEIAQNFAEDGSWTTNPDFANSNVVPYVWNSLWGAEDLSNKLANDGYPVVLSSVANFYFDLAYNKDPRESGLYWAGFVDTRDAFSFVPFDMFKSIHVSSFGKEYKDEDFEGMVKLEVEARSNILGLQGQLWSETVKGQDMMEYYILPKLMGLAERAWFGQAKWGSIEDESTRGVETDKAWNRFANVLGRKEFPRLDRLYGGYNYRLAPPGAKVENMRLIVNTAYPGMEVRYTTDGSDPTKDSPVYTGTLEVGTELIKLSTFDSRGRSSLPTVINLSN
jgi:hexosaminidase